MAMQTADNHTRLVRRRQLLWPFSRALTSHPDPDQPGIPSYIPLANEVAKEFAADLDAEPQSSLNEVLLNTSTTAHILGGCAIASDPSKGVVDSSGEVFGHPGLYVIDILLDELRGTPAETHVNWSTVDWLRPFGGIRIEDDIRVLVNDRENLTKDAFLSAS